MSRSNEEKINEFCKAVTAHIKDKGVPMPSAGDCMICSMFERDIEPGSKSCDATHLVSHMDETYIHGSLLRNALRWDGHEEVMFLTGKASRVGSDTIVRALRRFLKRQLGIA